MTKREEAIEAMGFAAWMAYCGYGPTRPEPEYDGDDTPEMWDSAKNNWDEIPTLCTHIGRDGFIRCATAAFDAAVKVLSKPDEAMCSAGQWQISDNLTVSVCLENNAKAEKVFKAMLKAAAL